MNAVVAVPDKKLIDGKVCAAAVYARIKQKAQDLAAKGVVPGLATVLVGEDPGSAVYVRQKIKSCEANGLRSLHVPLPARLTENELLDKVRELNADPKVHGMIVQLPLPAHMNAERVVRAIDPGKDADGLHPANQGHWAQLKSWKAVLESGYPLPCTPAGVMELLRFNGLEVSGKYAVVVGRSLLVGKPLSLMLLAADATVTMCHSRTKNIAAVCKQADILVAALGVPRFLKANMVKRGAVVIDVGISRTEAGLVGDVDFDRVKPLAKRITPVPGGVGAMTVAMLLWNTVVAAEKSAAR